MRILQLCKDMFDKTPSGASVKKFFQEMREHYHEEENFDDKGIFNWWSGYLGGRGYNEFLDYGLFALKLKAIFEKHDKSWEDHKFRRMSEAIDNLLHDDRHDMYQNVPYQLEDVANTFELGVQMDFWQDVVDAMIQCINVEGTGDIAQNFEIKEVTY